MKKRNLIMMAAFLVVVILVGLMAGCNESAKKEKDTQNEEPKEDPREKYIAYMEEKYADYTEVPYGLDITKKTDIVSICYSTWFTAILGQGTNKPNPPDISKILAGEQDWGPENAFHYWSEPELGYYRSDDKEVIRTHMTQLSEAGVDFIIIDNTNARVSWKSSNAWSLYISIPCKALLNTIAEMREEGLKTPYVVFWSKSEPSEEWGVVEATYREFYKNERWKDCFVYWEGKPLTIITDEVEAEAPEHFTYRVMYGLRQSLAVSEWSFLHIENMPSYNADGYAEQICVCCASQETYMSAPTAHGRNHGIFFYEQWKKAFEYRPKVVTLTWWNEWTAQRLPITSGYYAGQYHFTDAYSPEYSRDIEPMKGGHGDQYYRWMIEYIRAYRAGEECPRLVEEGY